MIRVFTLSITLFLSGHLSMHAMDTYEDYLGANGFLGVNSIDLGGLPDNLVDKVKKGAVAGATSAGTTSLITYLAAAKIGNTLNSNDQIISHVAQDTLQGTINGSIDGTKRGIVESAMQQVEEYISPTYTNAISNILNNSLDGIDVGIRSTYQNNGNIAKGALVGLAIGTAAGVAKSAVNSSVAMIIESDTISNENPLAGTAIGAVRGVLEYTIDNVRNNTITTLADTDDDLYCIIS